MFDARRRAIGFEAAKSFDEIATNFFFQSKKTTSTKKAVRSHVYIRYLVKSYFQPSSSLRQPFTSQY
jgi:hypothetical protein